jgi:hypothetical protein
MDSNSLQTLSCQQSCHFGKSETVKGVVAQILDNLSQDPAFSWSEVVYKGQ